MLLYSKNLCLTTLFNGVIIALSLRERQILKEGGSNKMSNLRFANKMNIENTTSGQVFIL